MSTPVFVPRLALETVAQTARRGRPRSFDRSRLAGAALGGLVGTWVLGSYAVGTERGWR